MRDQRDFGKGMSWASHTGEIGMKLTLAAAHSMVMVSVVYLLFIVCFDFPVMKTRRKRTET